MLWTSRPRPWFSPESRPEVAHCSVLSASHVLREDTSLESQPPHAKFHRRRLLDLNPIILWHMLMRDHLLLEAGNKRLLDVSVSHQQMDGNILITNGSGSCSACRGKVPSQNCISTITRDVLSASQAMVCPDPIPSRRLGHRTMTVSCNHWTLWELPTLRSLKVQGRWERNELRKNVVE